MSQRVRFAVAVVLLIFAWKGAELSLPWPPADTPTTVNRPAPPKPAASMLAWAEPLRPILPSMTPTDRRYLASLYDAMAFVLLRDGERDQPIVSTTDKFAEFHSGTLRLAVDRKDVGKYSGLGEAIDQTFIAAIGVDAKGLDAETRARVVAACGVLSWVFSIHGE